MFTFCSAAPHPRVKFMRCSTRFCLTGMFLFISSSTSFAQDVSAAVDVPDPGAPTPAVKSEQDKEGAKKNAGEEAQRQSEEDVIPAGHSMHGEIFNEGARQKAYLMEGCGDIDFPATTTNELVQKFINQGLGQMHGFWFYESERSFRQAAALDPDCAIAYWGMAYANVPVPGFYSGNEKRAKGFIKEAVARRDKASKREQMYIDALNNVLEHRRQETQRTRRDLRSRAGKDSLRVSRRRGMPIADDAAHVHESFASEDQPHGPLTR